jgi:hypothetical protein
VFSEQFKNLLSGTLTDGNSGLPLGEVGFKGGDGDLAISNCILRFLIGTFAAASLKRRPRNGEAGYTKIY